MHTARSKGGYLDRTWMFRLRCPVQVWEAHQGEREGPGPWGRVYPHRRVLAWHSEGSEILNSNLTSQIILKVQ